MKTILDDGTNFRTRTGKRVINLVFKPGTGSFPIKGTIIECEKPLRTSYQIWNIDGKAMPLKDHSDDLFIVPTGVYQ